MKASETQLLNLFKKSSQFSIPIYQRTYSWAEPECRQLWDDILRAGSEEDISSHFVGSIVYIESGVFQVANPSALLVIDGQQRLATVSLIIEALARRLGDEEPVDGFSAKKLREYYLLNPLEEGDRRYKILLTQTDKQTLISIVDQKPLPREPSLRLEENLKFFEKRIKDQGTNLESLCKGLAKLMVVYIALDRSHDNPQLIFESMNSTGRELSQADLIRNFVLMGLEPELQTRLYERYWWPMEVTFGQEPYSQYFDSFMRHYLTVRTDEIPKIREVYEKFKFYARGPKAKRESEEDLVADVHRFANDYCAMALGKEENSSLNDAFQDLRELKVDVAYPFLLRLYRDYRNNLLPAEELERIVRLVESYVFRRAVCSIPTNSLNKTFATFSRALRDDNYLESIEAHFLLMPSYRRFPKDDEFCRELLKRNLYQFPRRSYWLRKLENYGKKEKVEIDNYTIEHILPQNENLSREWRETLGDDWKSVQETWLHTLGNLTLTGYNSRYGDRPFAEKRDMEEGFRESPLRLNKGLGEVEVWNEEAIKERGQRLAKEAVKVWGMPHLSNETLEDYRPKPSQKSATYSIDDYKYLKSDVTRSLFESFRQECLALDPCVTEEVLKHYIAYKAETNFVDVEPQKNGLRLSLNMKFYELHDPRKLTRDITNIGRWGNGDVEVSLRNMGDLPYVLGLVRQALEKQMGNENETE